MYYSVTFMNQAGQKKNTWEDWHLIPATPPMIIQPEPVYDYVDIPGRPEGPLDITGILNDGVPTFGNSSGTWEFYWVPENDADSRVDLVRTIRKFMNSEKLVISFEEDPGVYRIGWFLLGDVAVGSGPTKLTIKYTVEPTEYTAEDLSDV